MLKLDINEALNFLDMLEPNGRHTIASEAPFGGRDKGPKWEGGATFESHQKYLLINDIQKRQERGSNVYYSVNRPCKVIERQGLYGKNNIDDIVAIRALAFDIDFISFQRDYDLVLLAINDKLNNVLKPSVIINTGGGFHLIYFLKEKIQTKLFRPAKDNQEKWINEIIIENRSLVTNLAHDFEALLRSKLASLPIKVDNMSNIDRVMRLPGTVNYPKAEKLAKGQIPALAYIIINNRIKCDIDNIRAITPSIVHMRSNIPKQKFVPKKQTKWSAYRKAQACVDFIRDNGLADSNEWYTHNVMLPLIGAVHDDNIANQLTIEEAEELFLEAVSGGERYNTMGRGPGYFMRQWRSHRPEHPRMGSKSLGGLIHACKEAGMELPWIDEVSYQAEIDRQHRELTEKVQFIDEDLLGELGKHVKKIKPEGK